MHPYSTTSEERSRIPFAFAAVAIGLAWLLSLLVRTTHPPFWLEVPGTVTLYGLLYGLFRSYLWKRQMFQMTGIVKVPDISGEWVGYVTSSFDQLAQHHSVRVQIRQNWTHFLLQLTADHSESESIVASMAVEEGIVLTYQYRNTPKTGAKDTMHAHMGTGVLELSANRTELSGEYYSGRDRANQGLVVLTKKT